MSEQYLLLFKNIKYPTFKDEKQQQLIASYDKLGHKGFMQKHGSEGWPIIRDYVIQRDDYKANEKGRIKRPCPQCEKYDTYTKRNPERKGEKQLHCRHCGDDFDIIEIDYDIYQEYENRNDNLTLREYLELRESGKLPPIETPKTTPVLSALPVSTPAHKQIEPVQDKTTKKSTQSISNSYSAAFTNIVDDESEF